jgi:hypothetical protein
MSARLGPQKQKPFSTLWKVTRSTRPARASWVGDAVAGSIAVCIECVVAIACGYAGGSYTAPISCLIR